MTTFTRATLLAGIAVVAWFALDLLLALFAGVLLAIFLRTLAGWLAAGTGMRLGVALMVVLGALIGAAALGAALFAPNLARQSDQLTTTLPKAVSEMTAWLQQYSWGRWLLEQFSPQASGHGAGANAIGQATTLARRLLDGFVVVVVVLFTGMYLAAEPRPYVRGVLRLVPRARRRRVAEAMYATNHVLRWWLVGQAGAMIVVGLTMGIGLTIIGVQLASLLGVLAGLFEFIPFVGPLLALGPALVLALAQSTEMALYVLVLYGFVQTAEGYVLTPLVQRKAIEMPPVTTIAAQVGLSWAAGAIGLLVAVPVTAAVIVWTQMLYVSDRLGDQVPSEWEEAARADVDRDRDGWLEGLLDE